MDMSHKVSIDEQENNSNFNRDSFGSSNTFSIQFTSAQAAFIARYLPIRYSLQIQKSDKSKRSLSKKKCSFSRKITTQIPVQQSERSQRIKKVNSNYRESQQMIVLNNYSRASSQAYPEEIQESMKPCLKILQLLKSHKTSWPFREPVDPVSLGIPNYFDIIKQPMDLQTVQKNLKNKQYITQTQFHADINKIIKNSFEFNKHNLDFYRLTGQFERYYNKLTNEPSSKNDYNSLKLDKKKDKGLGNDKFSESFAPTLAEKKLLANQIKKLPKQYLAEVAEIVYKGQSPTSQQVNIEILPGTTIRELQKLVKDKMAYIQMVSNNLKREEQVPNESVQSSFESDSDS